MEERNAYTLKLAFGTDAGRIGTMSIPRVNPDLTGTQAATLMRGILDSGIVITSAGRMVSKESAAIITTVSKNFIF